MTYNSFVHNIVTSIILLIVFIMTLVISPYYVEGDQLHYRSVYEELASYGLVEGYLFYNLSLSSFEYIHFFLSWLSTRVMEKDVFIAISNSLLAYLTLMWLHKKHVFVFISALLVLTNFYFLVLYFSAERLKFGMIFLLFSILYLDRAKAFYFFVFMTLVSHVQFILVYASVAFRFVIEEISSALSKGLLSKKMLFLMLFFMFTLFFIWEQLTMKLSSYFEFREITDLLRMFAFFVLTMWYSKKRSDVILLFIPLFIAVLIVGGERVNMFGYLFFLYYALPVNRGINMGVLVTSAYFLFSSYGFLVNVLEFGDGFYVG